MKLQEAFRNKNLKGITYVETMLVVAIISAAAVLFIPFGVNFINKTAAASVESNILTALRKAQFNSIDNKNNSEWGVCLTGTAVRIFTGSCESPVDQENYPIPNSVEVAGLETIMFSVYTGEPDDGAVITISSNAEGIIEITLNSIGGINVERI